MAERRKPAAVKIGFGAAKCDQKDSKGNVYLPRQGKASKKKEHCFICLDDVDSDLMFNVDRCGHRFCIDCMKRHIEVKLVDRRIPNCPQHRCKSRLSINSCGELLTVKQSLMWTQSLEEYSISSTDRVHCPYRSCSHLMSKTKLSLSAASSAENSSGLRRCFRCGGNFCVRCKVPWHSELSCNDYQKLYPNDPQDKNGDAKLRSLADRNGWRQCPKCQHMVERSYGCNRIACRCGNAFCYRCGSEWIWLHLDCKPPNSSNDFLAAFSVLLILLYICYFMSK